MSLTDSLCLIIAGGVIMGLGFYAAAVLHDLCYRLVTDALSRRPPPPPGSASPPAATPRQPPRQP